MATLRIFLGVWLMVTGLEIRADESGTAKIKLTDLPSPPKEIATLLRIASVSVSHGERASEAPSVDGRRLAAETKFLLKYTFRNKSRWQLGRQDGIRIANIETTYSRVRLTCEHQIWFRKLPRQDGFWQNQLVLHELDHVKISSDPALSRRFGEELRRQRKIQREVPVGTVVNDQWVDQMVTAHVQEVFEQFKELTEVRYLELDRVTKHGLNPLPESSALYRLLRDGSADDQAAE